MNIQLYNPMKPITAFIFTPETGEYGNGAEPFKTCNMVETVVPINHFPTTADLKKYAQSVCTPYLLACTRSTPVQLGTYALERFLQIAGNTGAVMLYSDYYQEKEGRILPHPTIEYQSGSLRDDFDFGPLILYRSDAFKKAVAAMDTEYRYASFYDLRLRLSLAGDILRIPELLYTETETDHRHSGEKQFDYVNPKNRDVQIEMEAACTAYLKTAGGWLPPVFQDIDFNSAVFPVEATVVIPVRDRARTIADAVRSALTQQTQSTFNVIVVDNHSTDGTSDILKQLAANDSRLIHHIPRQNDLGIGGCWNAAVMHPLCGKFAVQLDSDDLYISTSVLETIVRAFYEQNCGMVVGSYRMVDFNLEEIPPGIIDHREWTPENGRNNALRINGLGAPRAFYTPLLRESKFPNVSYGEDYAAGLAISRTYRIGRIYEPLYLCRRWEENSDAALDIHKLNTYNFYKDKIRTLELATRKKHL